MSIFDRSFMPICIQIINEKTKKKITSAEELDSLITCYFKWIEGECHIE